MATELERGDASFCQADHVEGLKPFRQRQLGGLHDCAGRERSLMAEAVALITLEPPAIDQAMLVAAAARTLEAIGPASCLQSRLTLLLRAVQPLEFRQRKAFL